MLNFAFGMNLDPDNMGRGAHKVGSAILRDWKLTFVGGLATIVPSPGDMVYGGLWNLDAREQYKIDQREGYDPRRGDNFYDRITVTVDTGDEAVEALVYVMTEASVRKCLGRWGGYPGQHAPSTSYLGYLITGYAFFGLPDEALWAAVKETYNTTKEVETHA